MAIPYIRTTAVVVKMKTVKVSSTDGAGHSEAAPPAESCWHLMAAWEGTVLRLPRCGFGRLTVDDPIPVFIMTTLTGLGWLKMDTHMHTHTQETQIKAIINSLIPR